MLNVQKQHLGQVQSIQAGTVPWAGDDFFWGGSGTRDSCQLSKSSIPKRTKKPS